MTKLQLLSEKARNLPLSPGVYIMRDKAGEVIYVGKSKALKNRVSQYFQQNAPHTPKTAKMVSCVFDFDVILTSTEFEALVLECSLIKKYRPKYNILLKDDKGYPYIRFSLNEQYPALSVVSKPYNDNAKYFGPYMGRKAARYAIEALSDALKLPTCGRKFPRDIGKERPCLNSHLGKCCALCSGNVSRQDYFNMCKQAELLLEGKSEFLEKQIESEMTAAAENLNFELAANLRDKLKSIRRLGERQNVASGVFSDTDVIAFAISKTKCCITVLHYIYGKLLGKEYEIFDGFSEQDAPEMLSDFILQYYKNRKLIPPEILLSAQPEDISLLSQWLAELCGHKVNIKTAKKGEKLKFVKLAEKNAADEALRHETKEVYERKILSLIANVLGLPCPPHRIEAYDISNTAGKDTVAGMIVFENGRPKRSEYRRFRIKTVVGQNDVACMEEALHRRFQNFIDGEKGFANKPDLILIDGGIGQLGAAAQVLSSFNLPIPVFGMVKDDKHRTRAIVDILHNEINISSIPAVFAFIGQIQEEVHRFSIEYHRLLREKKSYASPLDRIEGVGKERKKQLMTHFKTLKGIKEADIEQLCKVVPRNIAEKIKQELK